MLLAIIKLLMHEFDLALKLILLLALIPLGTDAKFKFLFKLLLLLDLEILFPQLLIQSFEIDFTGFWSLFHEILDTHLKHLDHLNECLVFSFKSSNLLIIANSVLEVSLVSRAEAFLRRLSTKYRWCWSWLLYLDVVQ